MKLYITHEPTRKKDLIMFRRRFRLPYKDFLKLCKLVRDNNWMPDVGKKDALGKDGVCLELLLLGALRYLGRGWTFDDVAEATQVSEEVHRRFLHAFVSVGREYLYPLYVTATPGDLKEAESVYSKAGAAGANGSTDCTGIIIEKCSRLLKNQNLGAKSSLTTR